MNEINLILSENKLSSSSRSKLQKIMTYKKEIEKLEKDLKEELYEEMKKRNIKKFSNDDVTITKVDETTVTKFDSARFKKDFPEIYQQYTKESKKKGYVKIEFSKTTKKIDVNGAIEVEAEVKVHGTKEGEEIEPF